MLAARSVCLSTTISRELIPAQLPIYTPVPVLWSCNKLCIQAGPALNVSLLTGQLSPCPKEGILFALLYSYYCSSGAPLLCNSMAGYEDQADDGYYLDEPGGSFEQDLVYALDAGVRHTVNQALAQAIKPIKHHLLGFAEQQGWVAPLGIQSIMEP
ncbi:hypothetical protein NDU88_004790 [Pleurodeles waltl]|uniref:Uncharacterized protein n=1 Tax=Pleurodeles waltl TaxID=8319 RepID=A0AAV7M7B8_PLEWA|nr:hypothetical protein NDU88_004790 [Pleurodeles waltl]